MNENFQELWNGCLEIIHDNIGDEKFDTWFKCAKAVSYNDDVLTLELPSMFYKEQYEGVYYEILRMSLQRKFGKEVKLVYNVAMVGGDTASVVHIPSTRQSSIAVNKSFTSAQRPASPFANVQYADVDPQLNPAYNFDNYCVGQSNHLPFVTAEFIANHPEKTDFNPFFLYGEVGVGKTHLIQAIGLRIKETRPNSRVLYVTYREFQNQCSTAYMQHKVPDFIRWYENIDVLLIDDLQEISGKDGTMNVLFPIFNHLHQHGKHLIFTSDRAPVDLDGVTDRLIDRFKWGVVAEMKKPDLQLRKAILKSKAEHNGLDLPQEVIDVIADNADGSVRQLEGIVMGLITTSIARRVPIDADLAREVMQHTVKVQRHTINFDMIVEATAGFYHLNPDVIFSKSRVRDIADARQMIMYLAHKHTKLSSPAIGAKLNRCHATVLHGISAIADRIPFCKDLSAALEAIEADLKRM